MVQKKQTGTSNEFYASKLYDHVGEGLNQNFVLFLFFMCITRSDIAYLCPNMIHFDEVDFSECHSEEVFKFLLTLRVFKNNFYHGFEHKNGLSWFFKYFVPVLIVHGDRWEDLSGSWEAASDNHNIGSPKQARNCK